MSFTTEIWKPSTPTSNTKKTAMPTTELAAEDDWTKVKDPKEKKRIQNRVAQRTYRHRMKARLGELQARLESHEARRSQSADRIDISNKQGSTSPTPSSDVCAKIEPGQLPPGQIPFPHTNLYDHPIENPEDYLFPQVNPAALLHSPPASQPSPIAHGLLSPPTDQRHAQPEGKNSEDFMMDCLRFQNQLLGRLNNLQQDATTLAGQFSAGNVAMSQDCMGNFTPSNPDGMDLSFETFNADMKMQPTQTASPDSAYFTSNMTPTEASTAGMPNVMPDGSAMAAQQPRILNRNAPLDERFECIMEQAEAAGFDSFDSLVSTYYGHTFNESSPLANEQRMSRSRRLPKVISDVHEASSQWSDWERRGFQDEILKTAESIVTSEGSDARASFTSNINAFIEAQDECNPAAANEAILALKRAAQDELPNTWALTMALAADNRQSWRSDRSSTSLATILLLNYSGRIPNDQLLRLISICL